MTLVVLLAGLSLWSLRPGKSKLPVRGLALALVEEFEAARQLAISSGRPVALGIPTDSGSTPRASSVYRLEGWNKPLVTSSRSFRGDYPHVVFLAARWAGPTFTEGLASSTLSKFKLFKLDTWLPTSSKKDYIFCFTPDGGLVTNGLPAADGRYTVVVAQNPSVAGTAPDRAVISGADSALALLISPSGGVELVTGLPGASNLPSGGGYAPSSAPKTRTQYGAGGATVKISKVRVLPNPADIPSDQGVCVPGQVVTLEVYAYDPEGRALFSKWTQSSPDAPGKLGQFSYPYSDVNTKLVGEVDKMEFVYKFPTDGAAWMGGVAPPPGAGVFRARWNWTVPITSQPGEHYTVQADVRDVKGEVYIENPPPKTFVTPPAGRLLVERRGPDGLWQLVMMNPDGSGEKVLSTPNIEETMPSLDRSGTKMAFLQGASPNRYVKVRTLNGGPELKVAGPGTFTSVSISPDGAWVSYRDQAAQELITTRLDGSLTYTIDQKFNLGTGHAIKKSRTGWSQNSRYMLFERGNTDNPSGPDANLIFSRNLSSGNLTPLTNGQFKNSVPGYAGLVETPYAPFSYSVAGGDRVMLSLGNNNPVLVNFPVTPQDYEGTTKVDPGDLYTDYHVTPTGPKLRVGYGTNGSGSDNDYPDVSSDGRFLIWTRSPQTSGMDIPGTLPEDDEGQELWIVPQDGDNFIATGSPTVMSVADVRRAIWIPAEQP